MNRIIGLAIAGAGAVVLYFGWQSYQSVGSKISSAISGTPTDKALWLLIGGGVLVLAGLLYSGGILSRGKRR